MAVTADIKFTQASGATDIAGRAVKGIFEGIPVNDKVTITNGDNTNVDEWKIELLYNPPGSGLGAVPGTPVVLATAVSPTPSAFLAVDALGGCFRIRLTVWDSVGNSDIDIRNFGVPDGRGFIAPPYQKLPDPILLSLKADELNFGGQVYGWLGDADADMHYDLFKKFDDLPFEFVLSTPFTKDDIGAPPLQIVDLTSVGSDAVYNLPAASWRQNQRHWIAVTGPTTYKVTVTPPGGHTIIVGASPLSTFDMKPGNMASLLYAGSSIWVVLGARYDYYERSLVAGVENVQSTGFTSIGSSILLDPATFINGTFDWVTVIETSDALDAVEIRLFNVTLGTPVAATTLSTTNIVPTVLSATGITLATGPNLYSAQMRLVTTGVPNIATCRQAQVVANWWQP